MDKHSLELNDIRLTADTAPQCALYAILGVEHISLMAARDDGEVLALESWQYSGPNKSFRQAEWDFRQMLRETPLLQLPFGRQCPAFFHPNTTLVPRRLFQHGDLSGYFNLLLRPSDYVYSYEELPDFNAYLLSATDKSLAKLFADIFPQARPQHLASPMLRYIRSLAGISEHTVFVNLRHSMAQIAVFERQNLLYYNSVSFITATDLLYFVLLAYDQFRLDPQNTPLTVAGTILKDSELYRMLYRFVREIRFGVPPVQFHLPEAQESLPLHCYFDLFCLKNS